MSEAHANKIEAIEQHIKAVCDILGVEETPSNLNTPKRVAKMYVNEFFRTLNNAHLEELNATMTVFPGEGITSPVVIKGVKFHGVCEHHLLPFMGEVEVEYIPGEVIIGLSKIPRVVKYFSQRPQLQERLTQDIGRYLVGILLPKYLLVRIVAEHTCVSCRGAENEVHTETLFVYGGKD